MPTSVVALGTSTGQSFLQPHSFVTSVYSASVAIPTVPVVHYDAAARSRPIVKSKPVDTIASLKLEASQTQESAGTPKCLAHRYTWWTSYILLHLIDNILNWVASLTYRTQVGCISYDERHKSDQGSGSSFWKRGTPSDSWTDEERFLREIPQFVIEHAPLIHLYSKEKFWPCDVAEHLQHVSAYVNYYRLLTETEHRNLTSLGGLNVYGLPMLYLTSDDDVEDRPEWLQCTHNIPQTLGVKKDKGSRIEAPVPLIVVDKGEGIVDAFWFFFYSFNLGNKVLGRRYGNHVGDWEHTVVRFQNGEPIQVFFSEHAVGRAFTYEAVEKIGKRPVGYSATGTHAMYATAAVHPYILPWGLLHDVTDRGPLWDPALNMYAFTYEMSTETLRSSNITPEAPTDWFYFDGRWGDKSYRVKDERQYTRFRNRRYVDGPSGPWFKELNRSYICLGELGCEVHRSVADEGKPRWWVGGGLGEGDTHRDGISFFFWDFRFGFPFSFVSWYFYILRLARGASNYFGRSI